MTKIQLIGTVKKTYSCKNLKSKSPDNVLLINNFVFKDPKTRRKKGGWIPCYCQASLGAIDGLFCPAAENSVVII
jgi:hypothetical protein